MTTYLAFWLRSVLFNMSLATGIFPDTWKIVRLTLRIRRATRRSWRIIDLSQSLIILLRLLKSVYILPYFLCFDHSYHKYSTVWIIRGFWWNWSQLASLLRCNYFLCHICVMESNMSVSEVIVQIALHRFQACLRAVT